MRAAVVSGDRMNRKGLRVVRGALLLAALAAVGTLFVPGNASAQIIPAPGDADYCSGSSAPSGKFKAPNSGLAYINITNPGGAGTVTVRMWGTNTNCVRTPNPTCAPNCRIEVQTLCEFHCAHDHTAPFYWTVELVAAAAPGNYFLGWTANCLPIKNAPESSCIMRMAPGDQSATAHFGPSPDQGFPSAPVVTATPQAYAVNLTWLGSADPEGRLAGYDIHGTPVRVPHVARVTATTTNYRVTNLLCETTYTFRVEAFDWSGNTTSSEPVTLTTGTCLAGTTGPRPNTVIHVKPPKVTRKRTAYFHFGSGAVRATKYQCKLDRRAWRRCSGSAGKTYRRLKPGYHIFRVRAGNANGWDPTPARYRWRIRR